MTSVIPPTQYFPTIIYNPQFWNNTSTSGQYLGRIGTPTSIASLTTFTGAITTTDLTCVNVIQGTALNSNNAYSTNNNANATHYLTYTDLSTNGYGQLQKHSTLTFNPNQEILTAGNINATTSLQVGGVDISSIYFPVSSLSILALLGDANVFTQVNTFSNTSSGGSANFYNPPYISNTGFTFLSTSLITKGYADTTYLTSSTGASLTANNTFTGTNTFTNTTTIGTSLTTFYVNALNTDFANYVQFTNQVPKCNILPSVSNDIVNKNYVDTYFSNLNTANTYTATQTFNVIPKTLATPTASTDLIPKAYGDTNYSNATLLSSSNTFTGSTNYFNGNNFEANCVVNTGHIYLKYNGVNMIEIERYALYAPISISPDFAQITFNYSPVFRTSFYLDNNITQYVGSVYSPASLVIFDGSLSVSSTNGTFTTNTIEPTDVNVANTIYTTTNSSITIGNSSTSNDIIMNGNIKQNNYYRFKTNPTFITSATTLSSPFYRLNKFAMTTASGYTITLPEVNSTNLDYELVFKRMGGSLQTLTLAPTNTQPIFNDGNSRGQITAFTISTNQNLATLVSTQISPAFSGNFSVSAQPTNIINILSITGTGAYISVGQKITLPSPIGQRIINGYGTGNGGTGTYTCSVNITQNFTNQPYTASENYGWLLLENN